MKGATPLSAFLLIVLAAPAVAEASRCEDLCDDLIKVSNSVSKTACRVARNKLPKPLVGKACTNGFQSVFDQACYSICQTGRVVDKAAMRDDSCEFTLTQGRAAQDACMEGATAAFEASAKLLSEVIGAPGMPLNQKTAANAVPAQKTQPLGAAAVADAIPAIAAVTPPKAAATPPKAAATSNDESEAARASAAAAAAKSSAVAAAKADAELKERQERAAVAAAAAASAAATKSSESAKIAVVTEPEATHTAAYTSLPPEAEIV